MKANLKNKAKNELRKLKSLLNKISNGESSNDAGYMLLNDAAELVRYYNCVSKGQINKAYLLQSEVMDTDVSDLIDVDMFEEIDEECHRA
jgi:hypothetical protein